MQVRVAVQLLYPVLSFVTRKLKKKEEHLQAVLPI